MKEVHILMEGGPPCLLAVHTNVEAALDDLDDLKKRYPGLDLHVYRFPLIGDADGASSAIQMSHG